jgi:hypothetical protein
MLFLESVIRGGRHFLQRDLTWTPPTRQICTWVMLQRVGQLESGSGRRLTLEFPVARVVACSDLLTY